MMYYSLTFSASVSTFQRVSINPLVAAVCCSLHHPTHSTTSMSDLNCSGSVLVSTHRTHSPDPETCFWFFTLAPKTFFIQYQKSGESKNLLSAHKIFEEEKEKDSGGLTNK
jgi:hypothetical protein